MTELRIYVGQEKNTGVATIEVKTNGDTALEKVLYIDHEEDETFIVVGNGTIVQLVRKEDEGGYGFYLLRRGEGDVELVLAIDRDDDAERYNSDLLFVKGDQHKDLRFVAVVHLLAYI